MILEKYLEFRNKSKNNLLPRGSCVENVIELVHQKVLKCRYKGLPEREEIIYESFRTRKEG